MERGALSALRATSPRAYRPHRRGSADPFSLKTLHRRVFRALDATAVGKLKTGCRYTFSGAELGRDSVNNAMDKAAEAVERVKEEVTREH